MIRFICFTCFLTVLLSRHQPPPLSLPYLLQEQYITDRVSGMNRTATLRENNRKKMFNFTHSQSSAASTDSTRKYFFCTFQCFRFYFKAILYFVHTSLRVATLRPAHNV